MTSLSPPANARLSIRSATFTYFSFGVPIAMLGIISPDVRERFDQSLGALGTAVLVYGIGRASTALTGPRLVRMFGLGRAFVVALLGLATACAITALAPSWIVFLLGLAAIGMASGSIDSLGAGYIASIQDVGRAGLIHGAYGVGATLGPLIVIAAPSWRVALLLCVGIALAAVGAAISAGSAWPTIAPHVRVKGQTPPLAPTLLSLGTFCAFVAFEVTAGQWAFTHLTEVRGVGETLAAVGVSLFWGGAMVGRLALSRPGVRAFVDRVRLGRLGAAALVCVLALAVLPPILTVPALAMTGLALAPIVPTMFASTAARFGEEHAQRLAVWQLLATNLGGVGVPFLTGILVDEIDASVIVIIIATTAATGTLLLNAIDRLPSRLA